jgi:hypothetical protein
LRDTEKERERGLHSLHLDFLSLFLYVEKAMAFASFLGRVLFASIFILSAYQE